MTAERLLLTHDEAAARMRVCGKTLRVIRQQGLIPYVAVTARKIFYRPEDCDAYLDSCVTTAVPIEPTRRKSTKGRKRDSNVVSFTARRRERMGAR